MKRPPTRLLSAPLIVNWSLTYRCNFDCRHCYTRMESSPEMEAGEILEAGRILARAGVLFVNFGGGEPLLRPDLFMVSRDLADLGLSLSMNSNGWSLDAAAAASLKEAGFASVGLSLDSHLPEVHDRFRSRKGSFQRVMAAAGDLVEAGMKLTLSTVISRVNHRALEPLLVLGGELGASQIFLHNLKCSGKGLQNRRELDLEPWEWREFYRQARSLAEGGAFPEISFDDPILASLPGAGGEKEVPGSTCGKLSLHMRPNGDLTPCGFIPLVLGNILNEDFGALWQKAPLLVAMRNKSAEGKCRSCGHYSSCLGGCTARAYALTGNLNAPDPHCWVDNSPAQA